MLGKPNPWWEYKYVGGEPRKVMETLTEESAAGWAPVFFTLSNGPSDQPTLHVVMQRAFKADGGEEPEAKLEA